MEAAEEPAAAPAAEAALRLLHKGARWQDTIDFLVRRASRLQDPSLLVTLWYRAGETAEGPLGDLANARIYYERVLELAPGYLPVLEALERVYHRVGAWAELAAVYEQRALLAEEPAGGALLRHRAGATYEVRLGDFTRAKECYRSVLTAVPDFSPSVDAYARLLEGDSEWVELGRVLRAAASTTRDSMEAVSLYYRAGRVLADHTTDTDGACACLKKALENSPGFLPAVLLLKDLVANAGKLDELLVLERAQADMGEDTERRHWRLLAAAEIARAAGEDADGLASLVLREQPSLESGAGGAAVEVMERSALRNGDAGALASLYRAAAEAGGSGAGPAWVRLAEVALEAGDSSVLAQAVAGAVATGGLAAPMRTLARSAESAGRMDLAAEALRVGGLSASVDAVRVSGASGVFEALAVDGADPALAQAALRLRASPAEAALAQQVLARAASNPGIRANHAKVAATLYRVAGNPTASLAAWVMAFDAQPTSRIAFEGLRGALIAAKDGDALRAAYARLPAEQRSGLGEALEEAGDIAGALACYRAEMVGGSEPLPWSVCIERALASAGDWRGVFDLLTARATHLPEELRGEVSARCRWILAEKLSGSDEAWSFYQQLHAANPADREVLEALARIAGARGDSALAIGYLEDLARGAASPADAARYQRRTADVHEVAGNVDAARASYSRALDVDPLDAEALQGLRRLGEAAGDWESVVRVLERTAALATGRERVERYAEVARIYEDKIQNLAIALDSWRKVLDLAPEDQEALRHMLGLSEAFRDWTGFVEVAQALLPFLEGEERSALQSRIGRVYQENLRRDDDAVRFLDAATGGAVVDAEAALLLERIYTGRGDWDRSVDAMQRVSRSTAPIEVRVAALWRAAQMRLDMNRDRPAASAIYDRLLELDPEHHEALRFRAEFLYEAGNYAQAASIYDKLEPQESKRDVEDFDEQVDVAMFYYRSAEALRRSGRGADAMARYERALTLNPTHLPSLEAVGPMYTEAGQWQRADKVFKQVLQLTGGHGNNEQLASVYANLGIVELNLGQPDKARKRFSKALELRANEVLALRGLATVLFQANDWNNLLNIYNNIIYHTQEPADVVDAYVAKGFVLDARLHLPEKAAQHYEKGLAFDGNQPVTLLRLAELALRRQDWPEAASIADRGLMIAPVGSPVRGCLLLVKSIAFQACGDIDAANESWGEACAQHESVAEMLQGTSVSSPDEAQGRIRQRLQAALKFA
jgi:tetratricopeptide (TPR) repeat protein